MGFFWEMEQAWEKVVSLLALLRRTGSSAFFSRSSPVEDATKPFGYRSRRIWCTTVVGICVTLALRTFRLSICETRHTERSWFRNSASRVCSFI